MEKDEFATIQKLHQANANLTALLEAFGADLARTEGYKQLSGMDAVHLYLVRKYGWLPRDVLTMRPSELRLALHVEMQDWTLPPSLR
jgi:hypothetical protein